MATTLTRQCSSSWLPSFLHGRTIPSLPLYTINSTFTSCNVVRNVFYSATLTGYHHVVYGTHISNGYKRNIFTGIKRDWTSSLHNNNNDNNSNEISYEKENIWTIPNLLTGLRILSSPVLGYLIINGHYKEAVCLFTVASTTDLLDGLIARHFPSQSSKLGSILDPLADKCLIAILYISLTYINLIPLSLSLLILSRDVSLITGSFYLRYLTLPPPRTFRRFWDIERSGLQITPNLLGKANTVLQLTLIGCTMIAPLVGVVNHPLLQGLWYIVGTSTVASWISYCVQLKGFQIINQKTK